MNTTSGPGQHHGEVALYVAHIYLGKKKQQIKMLMTDLLIFVLVPVFVFACKRARATFFFKFKDWTYGATFFSIFKTWALGPPFFNF